MTTVGATLILVGFAVAFFGIVVLILKGSSQNRVHGGAVIMIGPVPIILGTEWESVKYLILGGALLLMLFVVISFRRWVR